MAISLCVDFHASPGGPRRGLIEAELAPLGLLLSGSLLPFWPASAPHLKKFDLHQIRNVSAADMIKIASHEAGHGATAQSNSQPA